MNFFFFQTKGFFVVRFGCCVKVVVFLGVAMAETGTSVLFSWLWGGIAEGSRAQQADSAGLSPFWLPLLLSLLCSVNARLCMTF